MYLILLLIIAPSSALIGFDCGGSQLNRSTISLLDIGDCGQATQTTNHTTTYVQLLQLSNYDHTEVIQCKVTIKRTVLHCGMHSHVSAVHNGQAEYVADVTYDKCLQLHQDGTLSFGNNAYLTGLRRNATNHRSVTLAGSLSMDGTCSGTQYSDPYGTWDQVIVQAVVEVELTNGYAPVALDTGKVILRSGTTCELLKGTCLDSEAGYSFWKPMPLNSCGFHQYDVLYEGVANKIQEDSPNSPTVYSLTTQDITFALTKTQEELTCGYTLLRTEHPKLFLVETQPGNTVVRRKPIPVDNLDIFAYVNSKFVYVEKHIRTQMTSLYNNVMLQKCRLERQVLKNALALSTLMPDEFAFTLMQGPGYMAVTAGEVIHVIQCIPIEVKIKHLSECYNELPVTYKGETNYLTPKSRILTKFGTAKGCSSLLPVMYRIEDTWIKFTPTPTEVVHPEVLEPLAAPTWKYLTAGPLATSGIYSEKDVEKLRDHIMFPAEKPALLHTVARGIAGHGIPPNTISISELLDEASLAKITERTASKIWNGFITFGSASAGVLGIFIVVRLVKLFIDTLVHGYTLHAVYGCSIHLLGALWSSITHLLMHLAQHRTRKITPAELDNEDSTAEGSPQTPPVAVEPKETPHRVTPIPAPRTYPSDMYVELNRRINEI